MPIFNREYIFKRVIFHCHVSLPEGNSNNQHHSDSKSSGDLFGIEGRCMHLRHIREGAGARYYFPPTLNISISSIIYIVCMCISLYMFTNLRSGMVGIRGSIVQLWCQHFVPLLFNSHSCHFGEIYWIELPRTKSSSFGLAQFEQGLGSWSNGWSR